MKKFNSNYMITMKDIVKEGNPILNQATHKVPLPPSQDDKETLICMLNFLKNSQEPALAKKNTNYVQESVYPQIKSV